MIENSIWFEKYSPKVIEDVILPSKFKNRLLECVKNQKLPNFGFWSAKPGLGKTSTARALIKSLDADAMFLNASLEKGIDVLRTKIFNFASQESFDDRTKIVVLDECLEENEEVILIENGKEKCVKLKDLEKGKVYECLSFNLETGEFEIDTCEIISDKIDTVYEVELEDGRKIQVTSNHPFIIEENGEYIEKSIDDGLSKYDDLVIKDDIFKRIKSITKLTEKRVINLTVHKNHTFITKNGIVTHNCDNLGKDFQQAARGFLDEFSCNCSFIFTGNYKSKIIEPLLDRLENYDFCDFNKTEMIKPIFDRLIYILESEKVEVTNETKISLANMIKFYFPCIRSMVRDLQKCVSNGNFEFRQEYSDFGDIFETLKQKKYLDVVKKVNTLNNPDGMFEFLYNNIEDFKNIPNAIIKLADYQFKAETVRDKNLNLSACLVELMGCL